MLRYRRRASSPSLISLDRLTPGAWAEVVQVKGPMFWRRRLYAMGFRPGSRVYVEHAAPLGDPVQYWVQGTWLALRRQLARQIWVKPMTEGDSPPMTLSREEE